MVREMSAHQDAGVNMMEEVLLVSQKCQQRKRAGEEKVNPGKYEDIERHAASCI